MSSPPSVQAGATGPEGTSAQGHASSPVTQWTEHVNAAGRTYYYHAKTRTSTWVRPAELGPAPSATPAPSPAPTAAPPTGTWREYRNPAGKPYYYNTTTKQTTWTRPKELGPAGGEGPASTPPASASTPAPTTPSSTGAQAGAAAAEAEPSKAEGAEVVLHVPVNQERAARMAESPAPVGLRRPSAASGAEPMRMPRQSPFEAFREMLQVTGVDPDWSWEETMRHTVTHPNYKALPTPSDRKACWLQWREEEAHARAERRQAELAYNRVTLTWLLTGAAVLQEDRELPPRKPLPITRHTTLRDVQGWLAEEPAFASIPESDQFAVWTEFIADFRRKDEEQRALAREQCVPLLHKLLASLPAITHATPWAEGRRHMEEAPDFRAIVEGGSLDDLDLLLAYEERILQLDKELAVTMDREHHATFRCERHRREAFKSLLADLASQGLIHANSKWKELYPSFAENPAYLDMVGQTGSTPIELLWDLVEDAERTYRRDRPAIERFLHDHRLFLDAAELVGGAEEEEASTTTTAADGPSSDLANRGAHSFEAFLSKLPPTTTPFSIASLQAYYLEAQARAKSRALARHEAEAAADAARHGGDGAHHRHRRALDRYKEYVTRYHDYSFERIERRCIDKPEFAVLSRLERWTVYEKYADREMVRRERQYVERRPSTSIRHDRAADGVRDPLVSAAVGDGDGRKRKADGGPGDSRFEAIPRMRDAEWTSGRSGTGLQAPTSPEPRHALPSSPASRPFGASTRVPDPMDVEEGEVLDE